MLIEAELSRFMYLALFIAGLIVIILFLVDMMLGVINRSAQHFRTFLMMKTKS